MFTEIPLFIRFSHTYIITVIAEDRDIQPENRDFSYEILSGNELGKFQIAPTGKIETTGLGILDRETMSKYTLVVGARDKRDPAILGKSKPKKKKNNNSEHPARRHSL